MPVDWTHHTFALSPFYCYSKSSVFTSDGSLLPHLELEMGVTPGKSEVLLYINMDPRWETLFDWPCPNGESFQGQRPPPPRMIYS